MGALGYELRGPNSDGQNAQRQRLDDGLSAVLNIQLAQNLLYVIFYRQRADLQDGSDLDVALAEVNPPQDFLLARSKKAGTAGMCAGAFCRPVDLGAHPCLVQERHDQFYAIELLLTHRLRPAGESEQAHRLPVGVVGSVRDHRVRSDAAELARQRALGERTG